MFDGVILFDHPVTSDLEICGNIRKNAIGQGDDYTTTCLINYPCFKKNISWLQQT